MPLVALMITLIRTTSIVVTAEVIFLIQMTAERVSVDYPGGHAIVLMWVLKYLALSPVSTLTAYFCSEREADG